MTDPLELPTIKPCPFCGSDEVDPPSAIFPGVFCQNCQAVGPYMSIELWNSAPRKGEPQEMEKKQ